MVADTRGEESVGERRFPLDGIADSFDLSFDLSFDDIDDDAIGDDDIGDDDIGDDERKRPGKRGERRSEGGNREGWVLSRYEARE